VLYSTFLNVAINSFKVEQDRADDLRKKKDKKIRKSG
jgi:hypothetical protein